MSLVCVQVLARNPRAATTIVQEGALPALAAAAGEGLSDRARLNAAKVTMEPLLFSSPYASCAVHPRLCMLLQV